MPTSFPANREPIVKIVKELNPKRILDIGIGWGVYGSMLRVALPDAVIDGVEVWDYETEMWKSYNHIYRVDLTDFDYPKYDVYLIIDVIEHLTKEDARKLLDKLTGKIMISTPRDYPQDNQDNPFENHISKWVIEDFKNYKLVDYSNKESIIVLINK